MDGLGLIRKQHDIESKVNELLEMKNFKIVQTVEERDALTNVKNGEICFVELDNVYYSRVQGEWDVLNSGSGNGGAIIGTLTSTLDQQTLSIAIGEPLEIDVFFSTPNVGAGTLYIASNGVELQKKSISMGSNKTTLNFTKGTHKLEIYAVDRGGVYTNVITLTVQCGGLDISTDFDSNEDYPVGMFISFPYMVDTISEDTITTYFKIGNKTYETTSENGYNTYDFPDLGVGTYTVEIYSVSGDFESNRIKFTLVILGSDSLYVSSLFDKTEAEVGDQLVIDYRISMQNEKQFNVEYFIDGKSLRKSIGYNGTNTFLVSDLEIGNRKITIKVTTIDEQYSAQVDIDIEIKESSYQLQQPITQGLMAWFDAYGLSNIDLERETWRDKTGKYTGTLHNFNYSSNGWIKNGLKMNGSAYAKIDLQPFINNALTGLTIDIEFETEDVGNENARVLDCTTTTSSGIGCYIDTNQALIKSDANTVKSPFAQKEKTRVTYVIDRFNKLTKVYVNAVLCEAAFLKDVGTGNDKVLENFKHPECIYLNSAKGTSNFGDCTVYSVRVYGRPLNSDEVLQNHIADIKDKVLQKKKYDFNHNNTIPTMYFYGDTKAMTKDNKVPLRIKYVSTDDKLFGTSFDLENCDVQWQGTSSLQYAVKNYKIRLKDTDGKKFKRPLREGMIPESKFVLKADYMESSHANNTGLAKIVNRYLYESKLPPQENNPKVVSAIDGFPIKLYINDKLLGVFNFNLDKGCDDSFGLDLEKFPNCISYEISANTDTTAGAFNKWTEATGKTELEYLKSDFELRFPDDKENPDYGYIEKLKRVVDWVSDAEDEQFKNEFEQYFNKEYTLKYYLFVLVMGMVDNLGKNMMLNTWDGEIWYPCFYDLDTCLALDNSGYVKFDVDIEMTAGIYNTSNSKLWSKVGRVFAKDIAQMYIDMRSKIFKEENIFKVLLDEQVDQIPELLYNLDSQQKYLNYGTKYIHMLHGSRREHMRKWVTERLLYLDSKLGYEEHTKESITIRANKQGNVYFNIKTYSPMYIKVRWRNGEETVQKVGRNETVKFAYNIPTATDQEIFIYSAKHLKEIGDLTNMTPSSLSIGDATRLTKLVCTNNPNLQALGMDGNLKNLQLIDLTNCSKLGIASGNNGLDISRCDNLKTLKLFGTALQNITFNPKGGNLEEIYMSNSITSLHVANQYSLKSIRFPKFPDSRMSHRSAYDHGSKISNLTITNCINLTHLGLDTSVLDFDSLQNYRGQSINKQSDDFDISKSEYKQAYSMSVLGRLENITIDNSLLNYKYSCIHASPSLKNVSFNNMPNLKGLIMTGNRAYTSNSSNDYTKHNCEGIPQFNNICVNNCPNFDSLILQKPTTWLGLFHAYKFTSDFTWDLSHLPIKTFICNVALQNLKKLILPDTIKEFSHSLTSLSNSSGNASDGSSSKYTIQDSPLETIVVKGHYSEEFKGIDLANIPLKNVNLKGLTQKVNTIKNVNCEAIDLIPVMVSPHYTEQKFESILINLNNYKETSLVGLFKSMDMTNVRVILENPLTTENMNYEHMFYQTKNMSWENMEWIKKLPKGRVYQTFYKCEAERLEVGNMIGTKTTDLVQCFSYMPNITYLDVTGADISAVTSTRHAFSNNKALKQIIGLETLDFGKVIDAFEFLYLNPLLTNVPIQILSKFKSLTSINKFFADTPLYGTENPVQIPDSVESITALLGHLPNNTDNIIENLVFEFGSASKLKSITELGVNHYPVKHIKYVNMPSISTYQFTISSGHESQSIIQSITGINASKMTNICYPIAYRFNIPYFGYYSFKKVSFVGEIDCPELYLANLKRLETDCLVQIISQLKDKTNETSGILNLGKNVQQLTQDQIAIATAKNWSVV